ncbi:aminotransferase class III-fold pyridoxal phosphate-dependent enzyme [uncultured Croceitalea sp.]|uniref:aminotransferase class III-fold pyridoxal phosphate-dependent enzyme n=1 Tax=uncultured Croceitalea sp. TaxID=1798908 RepID=UPI0033056C56
MELKEILETHFGLANTEIKKLAGYENVNYKVTTTGGSYILKTYRFDSQLFDILHAENEVLLVLADEKDYEFPKPLPFLDGSYIKTIEIDGIQQLCRMLSFLEGQFLGDIVPHENLAVHIGTFLAKMSLKLKGINNYTLKSREWEWDLQCFHLNQDYLQYIKNPRDRNLVRYFFQQYNGNVRDVIPKLRKQIIHNDANEWNLLIKDNVVSGIIDFGDVTHAPLINEVAIAMTYIAYDKPDPLKWAKNVLTGYHQVNSLLEAEIDVLYYLIAARLCTSVCNSALSKTKNPDNTYASVSELNAWSMLYKWIKYSPIQVRHEFKEALGFPTDKTDTVGTSIKRRLKHISPLLSISYKQPIAMDRAAFQYMYDKAGNTFLDAYNNIPHVGHSHPKVVEAAQRQMAILNTNTRYVYDLLAAYAERLLAKCPQSLNKVFFVNSGSAASDLAIRMAKAHTQKEHVMVMEHGYHGNTQQSIDVSDYKFSNSKGQGQKEYVLKTKLPDTYRGEFQDLDAGMNYAKGVDGLVQRHYGQIAAFITESVVGCGGQVPLANDYLKEVYPLIKEQGGVCIADEVQTGFGRLGDYFWGFEQQEVVPDILILGKPMGNGHPIGAVVTTDAVAASFDKGVEFFSSFGGNPVSCAVGLAVLEVIDEEGLQENAQVVGNYYRSLLKQLQNNYPTIGDVRGSGLFLGVDIVHEGTKLTNHALAQRLKNELRAKHILISTDGPDDSVLKTKPPLCFTKQNAETVVHTMDEILAKYT